MRTSFTVLLLITVAAVLPPAGALAGGGAETAHASAVIGANGFLSPDRSIWCSGNAKEVGCVSLPGSSDQTNHGAILKSGGGLVICPEGSAGRGWKCFQNFDEKAPVLHYGRRLGVGAFVCVSTRQGITCTVRASGRGFRIGRHDVAAVR
jgi:hypothetical protein